MKRLLVVVALAVLSLALGAVPALADSGHVSLGEDIVVRTDEVIDGDVVAFGGNISIEQGARVTGNVLAFGGEIVNDGRIEGDLVAFGGDVTLGEGSYVGGQLTHLGGNVTQAEDAVVVKGVSGGGTFSGVRPFNWGDGIIHFGDGVQINPSRSSGYYVGQFGTLLLLVLLATLISLLLPRSVRTSQEPMIRKPWLCLGVGALVMIVAAPLGLVLMFTICLAPTGGLLWLGVLAASIMGWVTLGHLVGSALLRALSVREFTLPVSAIVGVAVLFLLTMIPFVGFLFGMAVTAVAVGAEVLTLFGTRPFAGARRAPAPVPVLPPTLPLPPAEPPAV